MQNATARFFMKEKSPTAAGGDQEALLSVTTATAFSAAGKSVISSGGRKSGRAELCRRERHGAEYGAGIVVLCRDALLIRHAVLGRMDEILRRSYDAHHLEISERNGKISAVAVVLRAADPCADATRNVVAAATPAARLLRLSDLGVEDDGVHHLYCCPLIGTY